MCMTTYYYDERLQTLGQQTARGTSGDYLTNVLSSPCSADYLCEKLRATLGRSRIRDGRSASLG